MLKAIPITFTNTGSNPTIIFNAPHSNARQTIGGCCPPVPNIPVPAPPESNPEEEIEMEQNSENCTNSNASPTVPMDSNLSAADDQPIDSTDELCSEDDASDGVSVCFLVHSLVIEMY